MNSLAEFKLFGGHSDEVEDTLAGLITELVFPGAANDFEEFKKSPAGAARLIWEAKTERLKLSEFAEEFFRRLAAKVGGRILLTKGELHRMVDHVESSSIPVEVKNKLDLLEGVFRMAREPAVPKEI